MSNTDANKLSADLFNTEVAKSPLSSVTITANVHNRSRTDVRDGSVTFQNNYDSKTANFGSIPAGRSESRSVQLDGYALTAIAVFNAADGTGWGPGFIGDGTAFEAVDINLNAPK